MTSITTSRATVIACWIAASIGAIFWITAVACQLVLGPDDLGNLLAVSFRFTGFTLTLVCLVVCVSILAGGAVGRFFCPIAAGAAGFLAGVTVFAFLLRMDFTWWRDGYLIAEICTVGGLEVAGIALGLVLAARSRGLGADARGLARKGCLVGSIVGVAITAMLIYFARGPSDSADLIGNVMWVLGYAAVGGAVASMRGVETRAGRGIQILQKPAT